MNYFKPKTAAIRYAHGRLYFHENTIRHIEKFLQLRHKLDNVLDVACGTGLSTKALSLIANNITGTDISQEMLRFTPQAANIKYIVAPAEHQPFANHTFDLITVSSGVHWFNIDMFLDEAQRLLKSKGWLVLYENHFISEMEENEKFIAWFPDVYIKQFPTTPRNNQYDWSSNNLNSKGLNFVTEEKFKNKVALNKKQLIAYFTSQSNIINEVKSGKTSYEEAELWLDRELTPFFDNDETTRNIFYGNWIKFIQKIVR